MNNDDERSLANYAYNMKYPDPLPPLFGKEADKARDRAIKAREVYDALAPERAKTFMNYVDAYPLASTDARFLHNWVMEHRNAVDELLGNLVL